jgi:hypothetical protein
MDGTISTPECEDVKRALQQGEDAVVELVRKPVDNSKLLEVRVQVLDVLRLALAGTPYLPSFVSHG